jgi:hypothetical protein
MKVFLSVALWGRSYAETFVKYALASQLSPGNIPKLIENHKVTYHLVTTHDDAAWMRAQPNFRLLTDCCEVIWDFIEDLGFLLDQIPTEKDGEKYPFMSRLQNIAFERSLEHDILVFNYADFIWADGSLLGTAELMEPDVDAVLTFCLPVDSCDGKQALDGLRASSGTGVLTIAPRVLAGIAVDHLHAEARLRMWDGPAFTTTPTYLLWPVGAEGLVVRAYHQTVLALRVKSDDPDFRAGIRRGSLDGYFSAELADSGAIRFADDSEQVLVFSLYDAISDTRLHAGQTREKALKNCLRRSVSAGQRLFADVPIRVKSQFSDADAWSSVERRSQSILAKLHEQFPHDATAFLWGASSQDIAHIEERWRVAPGPLKSAARIGVIPISMLGVGVLRTLRSLYVGRLLKMLVVPWLGPSQKLWIQQLGSRTSRIGWADLHWAFSNLGAAALRILNSMAGELKRALYSAAGRVGLDRVRGPGD